MEHIRARWRRLRFGAVSRRRDEESTGVSPRVERSCACGPTRDAAGSVVRHRLDWTDSQRAEFGKTTI